MPVVIQKCQGYFSHILICSGYLLIWIDHDTNNFIIFSQYLNVCDHIINCKKTYGISFFQTTDEYNAFNKKNIQRKSHVRLQIQQNNCEKKIFFRALSTERLISNTLTKPSDYDEAGCIVFIFIRDCKMLK